MQTCRAGFFLALSFFAAQTVAFCQQPPTESALVPHTAVKVSPLHLLNFYPTIELSLEQRILPRFTTQVEAGYVLDYNANIHRDFQDKRGVKLKLEGRYYFGSVSDPNKIYYGAIEAYTNLINFDRYASGTECFDLECEHLYRREYDYKVSYREYGLSFKAGVLRYFGSSIFMDLNGGITLRNVRYNEPARPRAFAENDEFSFFQIPNENDRVAFSPNLGLRFGYRFN